MENVLTEIEYAVGLARDEYVRSQTLVSAALRGRRLNMQRLISVALMLMCIASVGVEYHMTGVVDTEMAIVVTLMIVAELWMMLDMPRQVRRGHEAAYDTSLFSGHSFDGVLTVNEKGLVKRTADETNRVSFDRCTAFIEAEDMLLFCVTSGKSIVVPARCLTSEDAEFTKRMALAVISPAKQYVLAPIAPKLETRQPVGVPLPQTDEALVAVNVEYTASELKGHLTDTAIRGFFGKFSSKMLTAVFFTILAYFGLETSPLPLFLLALVLLFLMDIVTVRLRARRAIASSDGDVCRLKLELTDRYVRVTGRGEKTRRIQVPWARITRAVERPKEVEFFAEEARVVTVPKRCITDMEQLRHVVDAHMQ